MESKLCQICGKQRATDTHHLIFGNSERKLCDEDQITLDICRDCHNLIHNSKAGSYLSKMLGQAIWETDFIADKTCTDLAVDAREAFRRRYGRSYL